jgi:hypothetical protein
LHNESLKELGRKINAAATKMANANITLIQALAEPKGLLPEVRQLIATILQNNSLTSEEGETKGPE